jgi:hypothetical protein
MHGSKGAGVATPAAPWPVRAGAPAHGRLALAERKRGWTSRRAIRSDGAYSYDALGARERATRSTCPDVDLAARGPRDVCAPLADQQRRFCNPTRQRFCSYLWQMRESLSGSSPSGLILQWRFSPRGGLICSGEIIEILGVSQNPRGDRVEGCLPRRDGNGSAIFGTMPRLLRAIHTKPRTIAGRQGSSAAVGRPALTAGGQRCAPV